MGEMIEHAGEPTAKTESTTEKSIEAYQLEAYNGPKARVAVYQFTDQTAKGRGTVYGGYPFPFLGTTLRLATAWRICLTMRSLNRTVSSFSIARR